MEWVYKKSKEATKLVVDILPQITDCIVVISKNGVSKTVWTDYCVETLFLKLFVFDDAKGML